jgi:hypothetical protein
MKLHVRVFLYVRACASSSDFFGLAPSHNLLFEIRRQVFGRDKSMSIVAVLRVDGVEGEFVRAVSLAARGRQAWEIAAAHNLTL